MKSLTLLALLVSDVEPKALECSSPKGKIVIDNEILGRAFPDKFERHYPNPLTAEYRFRVDQAGRFVDCTFTSQQKLDAEKAQGFQEFMPYVMLAITTDVPNQPCVTNEIPFKTN
ncbi:MAG: hypothetical protein AAF687_06480 [Pseudomonadota bacterium]